MKYIILSDADNVEDFEIPRQLLEINGESLIARTVRLLKENGIKEILITSHDKRFDNLGAKRYEPKFNGYRPRERKGYWVEAFPIELLDKPVTFLLGDVYYSEEAIKTIVESNTESILYFCSYKNTDERYIKHHDEPFGFKVVDCDKFKEHIQKMKDYKDSGNAPREPIAWELYRSINDIPLRTHTITDNCIIINDETCDVDTPQNITSLRIKLGGYKMVKVKAIQNFTLSKFNEIKNLVRNNTAYNEDGHIYTGDVFECDRKMSDYLMGDNRLKAVVVEILEIIPEEKKEEPKIELPKFAKEVPIKKVTKPKTIKKKTSKK